MCEVEKFEGGIWECACGEGHLSKRFEGLGNVVISTDLIDRGFGCGGVDFFKCDECLAPNIVTNPPYKYAKEWVEKAMWLLPQNGKLALFLKIQFLEGNDRKTLFEKYPPKTIYCSSNRIFCGMNGEFYERNQDGNVIYKKDGEPKKISSATFYAWYVWEKGFKGDPIIKWIN